MVSTQSTSETPKCAHALVFSVVVKTSMGSGISKRMIMEQQKGIQVVLKKLIVLNEQKSSAVVILPWQ